MPNCEELILDASQLNILDVPYI